MKKMSLIPIIVLSIVGLIVLSNTFFTVHQTKQAIVLQFGEVKRSIREPGLHIKLPFVQNVVYYDSRILDLDPPPFEVLLTDKKRINVDAFVRYRIVDPSRYYQRIRTEARMRDRFGKTVNAALQRVLASVSLTDVLSPKRDEVMQNIENEVLVLASTFGSKVIDVRIGRTDLPEQTSQAVFQRMRTERDREARELRAEGNEFARKIRAQADKGRTLLLAESSKTSQILRGEGEAISNNTLAKAFNRDPEFFAFYKSLQQYRRGLIGETDADKGTTLVISPNSEFFRYFKSFSGR